MVDNPSKFDLLLIDGDVIAFIAAAAVQHTMEDAVGNVRYIGIYEDGALLVDQMLGKFKRLFGAKGAIMKVVLSDRDNWRYDVKADYKTNRSEGILARPLLLDKLKRYLTDNYGADYQPRLEADDYLSLLMTKPYALPGEASTWSRICIGRDKDFKSIPGWHYQIKQKDEKPEAYYITEQEADRWHLLQAIAGDKTDGFDGCPGMGLVRAAAVIDAGIMYVPEEGVLTSGKNKGQKTIKWHEQPAPTPWDSVVSCYRRAGLGEMEALDSARMAHLLRSGEYNWTTGEVSLWLPPAA